MSGLSSILGFSLGRSAAASTRSADPRHVRAEEEVIALFDVLRGPVMRYLAAGRMPASDAEEVVQEAFLLLFRRVLDAGLPENPTAWVFRTAHNYLLRHRDRLRRDAELLVTSSGLASHAPDPAATPDLQLEISQRQADLMAVVRALPETHQQCLHLRSEGLKYREIAGILGVSVGTVAASLQASLARLARADSRHTGFMESGRKERE